MIRGTPLQRAGFAAPLVALAISCAHRSSAGPLLPLAASGLREILFQAQRPEGTEDIYAFRPRDSQVRRLVRADSVSSRSLPVWSPDGRSIAFTREFGDTSQLYILDSLSGMPRRLAEGLQGFIAFPEWSPDGRQLLFSRGTHRHFGVYLINVDGSGLRPVLQDSVTHRAPSWAPNGREFAVSTYINGHSEIWIVDVERGWRRTVLAPDTAYADFPQWSPRRGELLLTVYHGSQDLYDARPRKYGSNLALLDLSTLSFTAVTDARGLNNYGRWSQDGNWIVFQSNRHAAGLPDSTDGLPRYETLEIYVVQRDGSGIRRLTGNGYFDGHPSW
jgi:Tol biopolymer transport system component